MTTLRQWSQLRIWTVEKNKYYLLLKGLVLIYQGFSWTSEQISEKYCRAIQGSHLYGTFERWTCEQEHRQKMNKHVSWFEGAEDYLQNMAKSSFLLEIRSADYHWSISWTCDKWCAATVGWTSPQGRLPSLLLQPILFGRCCINLIWPEVPSCVQYPTEKIFLVLQQMVCFLLSLRAWCMISRTCIRWTNSVTLNADGKGRERRDKILRLLQPVDASALTAPIESTIKKHIDSAQNMAYYDDIAAYLKFLRHSGQLTDEPSKLDAPLRH